MTDKSNKKSKCGSGDTYFSKCLPADTNATWYSLLASASIRNSSQKYQGSDCPLVRSIGETVLQVPCSVLGPSLQKPSWVASVCARRVLMLVKGLDTWLVRSGCRNRSYLVWRKGAWGETLSHSTTTWKEVVVRRVSNSFLRWQMRECKEMESCHSRIWLNTITRNFFTFLQALGRESDGGPTPGGTEETWGCGTKGHSLVMLLGRSCWWFNLTMKVSSKRNASTIHWNHSI